MVELNRKFLLKEYGIEESDISNLTELKLNDNKFTKIDCETFKGLTNLKKLNLDSNQIRKIVCKSFSDLSNLSYLNLQSNKLTRIDSNAFEGLAKLESLDLSWNQIREIDGKSFSHLLNLTELDLRYNKLTKIDCETFKGLTKLEILYLQDNLITTINDNSFSDLSNLTVLNLNDNKLEDNQLTEIEFVGELYSHLDVFNYKGNKIVKIKSITLNELASIDFTLKIKAKFKRFENIFEEFDNLKSISINMRDIAELDLDYFGKTSKKIEKRLNSAESFEELIQNTNLA